jgi:hypothetical protein
MALNGIPKLTIWLFKRGPSLGCIWNVCELSHSL